MRDYKHDINVWKRWLPGLQILGRYEAAWLPHNLMAGLVLTTMLVPVGSGSSGCPLLISWAFEAVAQSPTPLKRIVVTAEPVTGIDVTSADMLAELEQSLRESRIEMHFAEMKDPVKDKLKRFELFEQFGAASFHATVGAAVDAYVEAYSVDWKP